MPKQGDNALYLRKWAADIRDSSGMSVDADRLDSIADEIGLLRDALKAAEKADKKAINCEEHEPEMAPESCEKCFPLADAARLKRWAALGINQPSAPRSVETPSPMKP